ncbi:sigma-70 family RNA polymerase sigma factor [Desulfoscipio sp. XC116]|uniref:sigma-70 family RNA polymerase sigma factor n=1 Tax=Desulfoscipio sp. XC116 TaxID=3144975 RepID=UPI00325AAEE1
MPSGSRDYVFDPKEARAIAWFLTGLRREAIRLAKKYRQLDERELLILDGPAEQNADSDALSLIDTIFTAEDVSNSAEDAVFIQKALSLLTPQEQMVIKATILDGFTERETARELEVSQPVVHRIKNRALNKLHHFILDEPTAK